MLHQTPQEIRNRINNILIFFLLTFSIFSFCYSIYNVLGESSEPPMVNGEPSENFFITILENPFTSTILSTIFIAGAAYIFNKLRVIKKRLDSIAQLEKNIEEIKNNQDDLKESVDDIKKNLNENTQQLNNSLNDNTHQLNKRFDSMVESNNKMKDDIYEKLLSMAWSAHNKDKAD